MSEPGHRASCVVVLITAPDADSAARIAAALIEERLAACVGRLGRIDSRFRWDGKLESASEELLLAKTTRERIDALVERVRALHPYQVPEIIALPIVAGFERYLDWVRAETTPAAPDRQDPSPPSRVE
ncbi:MAG: divalent-cation tolerance protein CutA [Planctomycetes bacterium]|nr:divalent-cation tolerance protein CutA [Planctomycetota bacterium]